MDPSPSGAARYPHFDRAADAAEMRRVIERHLQPRDRPAVIVTRCETDFARRGDARVVVQHHVTVADPETGAEQTRIVSGIHLGTPKTERVWEEVRAIFALDPPGDSLLAAAAYAPDLDLLLQVFPFDHRLPALAGFMTSPEPTPGMTAIVHDLLGPGDWQIVGWQPELVRYRVDLRACVKAVATARNGGTNRHETRSLFAKFYASAEEWERAYTVGRDLETAIAGSDEPQTVAVAATIAASRNERMLVQETIAGSSLLDWLRGGGERGHEAIRRTARAIAHVHGLEMAAPPHRLETERTGANRVRLQVKRLSAARPDLAVAAADTGAAITARFAALGPPLAAPTHGDLKPAHILLDDQRVSLLDLDKFAAGEPMLDVTHLLLKLRRGANNPKHDWNAVVLPLFLTEYFAHVPAAWRDRLPPYHAAALLGEAAAISRGAVRANHQRKHGDQTARLLADARAVLTGGFKTT